MTSLTRMFPARSLSAALARRTTTPHDAAPCDYAMEEDAVSEDTTVRHKEPAR